jgi:hypothetical protein
MLDHLHYISGVFAHIFSESELFVDVFSLVELYVPRLEEMCPNGNSSLNVAFTHNPSRHPLSGHEVTQLNILAGNTHVHGQ